MLLMYLCFCLVRQLLRAVLHSRDEKSTCMYTWCSCIWDITCESNAVCWHLVRVVMQPLRRWQEAQERKCLLMRIKGELSWQTGALLSHKNSGREGIFSISIKNVCRKANQEVGRNRRTTRMTFKAN